MTPVFLKTFRALRSATRGCSLALVLAVGTPAVAADDIKVFRTPPSVEELRKALGVGDAAKMKSRSIVIDENEAAPSAAAPAAAIPATAPTATPASAPAAIGPAKAAHPRPAPQQTATVSEKAVAMQITFDLNSAQLRPEALQYLDALAKLMQEEPKTQLVIEGHTDSSGDFSRNMQLSRSRAGSVRDALVSRYGIAANRLIAIGKGPKEPLPQVEPTNPDNRRVQFRLRG